MIRWLMLIAAGLAAGCQSGSGETTPQQPPASLRPSDHSVASNTAAAPLALQKTGDDDAVARVQGATIPRSRLTHLLIETHGLPLLLNLVQLEMARGELKAINQTLSPGDIEAEHNRALKKLFSEEKADPADYPALFEQFLQRRNMSRGEWDLLMEINATLRKVAEVRSRGLIKDQQLDDAYRQLYGEKVQVRHIQCANLQEIADAKRRLAEGQRFDDVARSLSRNARTGPLGGELPPFTRQSQFPQAFKDAAFALKVNEISDPVFADNAYHLIKLERRIAPKVIKFEDVKASIREDLQEQLVQQLIQEYRAQLSAGAQKTLVILDPELKAQYDAGQQRREQQIRDRQEIRKELEREREKAATQQILPDWPPAATMPTTQP